MVGGPTLFEEEIELTEDGFPLTYDGMGPIRHWFYVENACDAVAMDWSGFLAASDLDWMVLPCVSRLREQQDI